MSWSASTPIPTATPPTPYICKVHHPFGFRFSGSITVNSRKTEYTIHYANDGVTPATTTPDPVTLPIMHTGIGGRTVTIFVHVSGSEVTHDTPKVKDGSGGGHGRRG
jgi:hypothetical protein